MVRPVNTERDNASDDLRRYRTAFYATYLDICWRTNRSVNRQLRGNVVASSCGRWTATKASDREHRQIRQWTYNRRRVDFHCSCSTRCLIHRIS